MGSRIQVRGRDVKNNQHYFSGNFILRIALDSRAGCVDSASCNLVVRNGVRGDAYCSWMVKRARCILAAARFFVLVLLFCVGFMTES